MNTYSTVFGNDTIPPTQSSYSALTLIENTILFWPELAQGVTLASDIMDLSAASPYALALPEADKVSNGRSLLLNNIGSADITITDSGGATLAVISAGVVKNVYLTDNSTVSGVWRVYTFGTGTSTADASSLAGYGLTVIAGDLAQDSPTHTTAGNATLAVTDRASTYIFKNTGMVTCGLLAANTAGSGYFVDLVNQGTGAVQINPDSSETIDGALTKDLAPGESARVTCDGTNWVTVGYGRSTQFQFTKLVLDITTGSPFTLTSTQAQNKLIQLIGSPTAPITITVPAVVAIYYIECSYSGAFHVTFGAGGTTIDLIGTDRVIAYCDGINVVFAQTTAIPATNIAGGVAGAVVVQTGIGATGFTAAGLLGQLFASNGTGIPQWVTATFAGSTMTVPQHYNVTQSYGAFQVAGVDVMRFGSDTSGQLAGFRNLIINGGMCVTQRGHQPLSGTSNTTFFADRLTVVAEGATGVSGNGSTADNTTFASGTYGGAIGCNWSNGVIRFQTRLEAKDTLRLNSGTNITISGKIYQTLGSPRTMQVIISRPTTNVDDFSARTVITISPTFIAADSAITPFSQTVTLPPGQSAKGLLITVEDYNYSSAVNKTFAIGDWQVEPGSIATPFENRPIGLEELLCQRYLPCVEGATLAGQAFGIDRALMAVTFPVTARVPPTGLIAINAVGNSALTSASGTNLTIGSVSRLTSGVSGATLAVTVSSGLVAGNATVFNPSGAKLLFDGCEL